MYVRWILPLLNRTVLSSNLIGPPVYRARCFRTPVAWRCTAADGRESRDRGRPPARHNRKGTGNSNGKRGAGKVYPRRFVPTRFTATLLADGAPFFATCACPALVIERACSYISIHFSLEIAEISVPIASSGKSSGDSK